MQGLDKQLAKFNDFLTTLECARIMRKDKIFIDVDTGTIYFANQNSGKTIYDLFQPNKIMKRKLLKEKLAFGTN